MAAQPNTLSNSSNHRNRTRIETEQVYAVAESFRGHMTPITFPIQHPIDPLRTVILTILLLATSSALANDNFSSGKARVSVSAGSSTAYNETYFQVGVGIGYYVMDGLEIGLDARTWQGGKFSIHEIAPSVTYVFNNFNSFKPYLGMLHRLTIIKGREDISAIGARAGFYLQSSPNILMRAGVVGIRYQDCDRMPFTDCTEVYPEVSAGFYF